MEEQIFFDQAGVSVSNARFIVHGQTYAMNNVTSVKQSVIEPSRAGPVILILLGLIIMLGGGTGIVIGLATIALGIFWISKQKAIWIVDLNTASGETQALRSTNREYIDSVIHALNQSIIHRG